MAGDLRATSMHNRFVSVPDFQNYLISDEGKIWTKNRNRFLKPGLRGGKYSFVVLCRDSKIYYKSVHRLVLEVFVGKCPDGQECRHLDGNSQNNSLDNLRWGTHSENIQDTIKHNTVYTKWTQEQVMEIKRRYKTGKYSMHGIAKDMNIPSSTVWYILTEKMWKHVKV